MNIRFPLPCKIELSFVFFHKILNQHPTIMSSFIHVSDINFTTDLVQRRRSKSFDDLRSSRVNTPEIHRFSIESCDEIPEEIGKTDYQEGGRDQGQELNHHCQNEAEDEDEDDISEEQREHNRLQEEQDRLWQEDDYRLWQEYDKRLFFELHSSELKDFPPPAKQELATVNTPEIEKCAEIPEEIGKTDHQEGGRDQDQKLNHHCQNEAEDEDEDDISEEQREHNRLHEEQDRLLQEDDYRLWQKHDKRVLRLKRDIEQDRIWQEHDKRLLPEHDKRVLRLKREMKQDRLWEEHNLVLMQERYEKSLMN